MYEGEQELQQVKVLSLHVVWWGGDKDQSITVGLLGQDINPSHIKNG